MSKTIIESKQKQTISFHLLSKNKEFTIKQQTDALLRETKTKILHPSKRIKSSNSFEINNYYSPKIIKEII